MFAENLDQYWPLVSAQTYRVSDDGQHANQGQRADGEGQSRQTICRKRDRKAITGSTLTTDRNILYQL